jgi:transposase
MDNLESVISKLATIKKEWKGEDEEEKKKPEECLPAHLLDAVDDDDDDDDEDDDDDDIKRQLEELGKGIPQVNVKKEEIKEDAERRWRRNNDARKQQRKTERTFSQWLRIDAKRKRRMLKFRRQRLHNFVATKKRQWSAKIAQAAGEGGVVIVPKLNFHKFERRLSRKVVRRSMQLLAHCSFVDRELTDACRVHKTLLVITGESHTTKTCPCCFAMNDKVGASKVFQCLECGYKAHRDGKGALCNCQRLFAFL